MTLKEETERETWWFGRGYSDGEKGGGRYPFDVHNGLKPEIKEARIEAAEAYKRGYGHGFVKGVKI